MCGEIYNKIGYKHNASSERAYYDVVQNSIYIWIGRQGRISGWCKCGVTLRASHHLSDAISPILLSFSLQAQNSRFHRN